MRPFAITEGSNDDSQAEYLPPSAAIHALVHLNPKKQIIFLNDNGTSHILNYQEIWDIAEVYLCGLRTAGSQPGDFVLLYFESAKDYVPILWSCIMGGFVPVPLSTSTFSITQGRECDKLLSVWYKLKRPLILTTSCQVGDILACFLSRGLSHPNYITLEELIEHGPDSRLHYLLPNDLSLLLTTSGTTGNPKLVESNALNFFYRFMRYHFLAHHEDIYQTFLSWYPLPSLNGMLISLPNCFRKNICFPTKTLLKNPRSWITALSSFSVTHASTSNFALSEVERSIDSLSVY